MEIATLLKDGLVEDGADEVYEYMCNTVGLSEKEAEALEIDMDVYKRKAEPDRRYTPSSTCRDCGGIIKYF